MEVSIVELYDEKKGDVGDPDDDESPSGPFILTPKVLLSIALGQLLALMIMGSGITSSYLAEFGINLPQFQGWLNYCTLFVIYFPILVYKGGVGHAFGQWSWLKYLVLGLIDVEANYMIVLAYQYASITSVQLLDNFTLPAVMILSFLVFNMAFRPIHILGAAVCLSGVITLVVYDYFAKGDTEAPNALLGDLLIISAASLYAMSNVAQEVLLRNDVPVVEWLAMIGLSGTLIGGIQFGVLEGKAVTEVDFSAADIGLIVGFVASMAIFYSLVPVLIKMSSATMLNLSLLTCDFYSVFAGVFLFDVKFTFVYAIAFVLSASGILVYNLVPEPAHTQGRPFLVRLFHKSTKHHVDDM